ncbi:polyphosphate kinase 1 [Pedobacter frigiditerrae]|uniref:Polyphosphate kinase n=1 Tax=Pedobacter frigiditerrae TaxID=2530452 RepID=A0A4R0MTZ0_9SPHI|nr:polyphosphate kinase 1 [Pedobacter frigiditerrae]TCC89414.1 polyphosphate kinase 1 [Pedobacter frigiditerrae]
MPTTVKDEFFDRDLSWLSFNERVLEEASRADVPLLERINFLSIYSSNLDEFYRVRMPVLLALEKLSRKEKNNISISDDLLENANQAIRNQQQEYGKALRETIIPQLRAHKINFIYGVDIPEELCKEVRRYFLSQVLAFLQPVNLADAKSSFFPNNNELYFLINLIEDGELQTIILNIPSNNLPRFYKIEKGEETFIVFLDDIIRNNFDILFKDAEITGCFSFKITRTAEIDLKDEYAGNLAEQIEKQLQKRDFGLATRFLHQPGVPEVTMEFIKDKLNLQKANIVEGGRYHNLKDLSSFPANDKSLKNQSWPKINYPEVVKEKSLHEEILQKDMLVNPPYQSYDSVLRFFNEAATDKQVEEIYVTLYRVASDSKIVNALISAAKNGKKVFVLVELKARFDEANNIKWAKKMKEAGVDIVYSVTALKVHAKIALVKRAVDNRKVYTGLFATGNFNETTANFYTDHILMTAHQGMLREMELLFMFLAKRVKPTDPDLIKFEYLLVAQFNLQQTFVNLINREILNASIGEKASIIIKLNNLEEKILIAKLYEASQAGVKIELIIRGICRLIPGVKGMSDHIKVVRIVDRYLEHGRVFVFHNQGDEEIYLGSADWMNRNIYRRIEVCFPIFSEEIKAEIKSILKLQLLDNVKAVEINDKMINIPVVTKHKPTQSQYRIYELLKEKYNV